MPGLPAGPAAEELRSEVDRVLSDIRAVGGGPEGDFDEIKV